MSEDKLSKKERLRLEALNQANLLFAHSGGGSQHQVLNLTIAFEKYIRTGEATGLTMDKTKQ